VASTQANSPKQFESGTFFITGDFDVDARATLTPAPCGNYDAAVVNLSTANRTPPGADATLLSASRGALSLSAGRRGDSRSGHDPVVTQAEGLR